MKKNQLPTYYFKELNYRLLYTLLGALLFFSTTYTYKQGIIYTVLPKGLSYFITTDLTEIFFTYVQICTFFTFGVSMFLLPIQLYCFLRPGLYHYEAKNLLRAILALLTAYSVVYSFISPLLLKLFWNIFTLYAKDFTPVNLTFEPRLSDYLKHVLQLHTALFFLVPCLVLLNVVKKNTTNTFWINHRGFNYLLIFSFAAIVTPPDILSQLIIGLPLITLYETQLFLWALIKQYRNKLIRQPIEAHQNTNSYKKQSQCQR